MLTVENKDGFYIIKNEGVAILEPFKKVVQDAHFENFYLGYCKDRSVTLFSREGEFVHKFEKKNAGVSFLIDSILCSRYMLECMKAVSSVDFWTDPEIVKTFRQRHSDLNKKRLEKCKDTCKVDVLYDREKAVIESFLAKKQFVKSSRLLAASKSSQNSAKTNSKNPKGIK